MRPSGSASRRRANASPGRWSSSSPGTRSAASSEASASTPQTCRYPAEGKTRRWPREHEGTPGSPVSPLLAVVVELRSFQEPSEEREAPWFIGAVNLRRAKPGSGGGSKRRRLAGCGQEETLAGNEQAPGQMVAAVDAVDRVAGVARVVARRDRPERVAGLHRVPHLRAGAVRGAGHHRPRDERQSRNQKNLPEHVFAMLTRTSVRVKPQ